MVSRIQQWMSFHAGIMLLVSLVLFYFDQLFFLSLPVGLSFLFLFIWKYRKDQSSQFLFYPANLVSSFRLLVLLLLGWHYAQIPPILIGISALVVLILDGLDGYLARKYQTSSLFGEYLDMETDAFYVLVLSAILYQLGYFGTWILGIGLLRYAYFLILKNVKPPAQKESRVFRARLIAVILMATMAACFILPKLIYEPAMVVAAVLVVYSFWESFWAAVKG